VSCIKYKLYLFWTFADYDVFYFSIVKVFLAFLRVLFHLERFETRNIHQSSVTKLISWNLKNASRSWTKFLCTLNLNVIKQTCTRILQFYFTHLTSFILTLWWILSMQVQTYLKLEGYHLLGCNAVVMLYSLVEVY
jgi:hypothetical protein